MWVSQTKCSTNMTEIIYVEEVNSMIFLVSFESRVFQIALFIFLHAILTLPLLILFFLKGTATFLPKSMPYYAVCHYTPNHLMAD